MDEATDKLTLPSRIDVDVASADSLSLTPNELRALKAQTGRTMDDLMGEAADDADRLQAMVWLELRRRGFDVKWNDAADVAIGFGGEPAKPDPTPTDTTPTSRGSVDSGE